MAVFQVKVDILLVRPRVHQNSARGHFGVPIREWALCLLNVSEIENGEIGAGNTRNNKLDTQ